ncbi:MAG: PAS and helix-turn-helix domain-containing protein [Pseudomonadota bacterium]|nr:PAS and helix-turn-helix domain-containing protein [Pseudomonadota bacterium]
MREPTTPERAELLGFRASPVAHLVTRYRRIVEINGALEDLFGFRRSELVGRSVRCLYPSISDFEQLGAACETRMREARLTRWEDERFMQTSRAEVFLARARGTTMTPDDPFALMIWTFDRVEGRPIRSVRLTPREREIAPLIGQGMTSRMIGERLGISTRTVETHRARLMKKFGVHNTAELVSQIVVAM